MADHVGACAATLMLLNELIWSAVLCGVALENPSFDAGIGCFRRAGLHTIPAVASMITDALGANIANPAADAVERQGVHCQSGMA
jgi:hypothetical protein